MASTLSSGTFLLNFSFLPVFVVVFLVNDLLQCLIISTTCQRNTFLSFYRGKTLIIPSSAFIAFSWKQLSLMALILPVLPQKFRGFTVFVHIYWYFEVIQKEQSHFVKQLGDDRKVITEKLFFNGFDTFLAQFFFELGSFASFFSFR